MTHAKLALAFLAIVGAILIGGYYYKTSTPVGSLYPVQTGSKALHTGISSVATSVRVRNMVDLSGNPLTMAMFGTIGYATLEPGTNREEGISFTGLVNNGDGTATLTGLTRGLLGRYPYGAGGTAYSHSANTYIVFSNTGDFYSNFMRLNTDATSSAHLAISSSYPWKYDNNPVFSALSTTTLASTGYVNDIALAGAPDASLTVKGVVELATQGEAASSTSLGATLASLALPASMATDTPNTATRASRLVMSDLTGYIKSAWLSIFGDNNTWTGANTFNATTTFGGAVLGANPTLFGDGSDGDVTITSTTTLTRDMNYGSVTINSGAAIIPNGFRIFATNTVTINGNVWSVGNNGSAGSNGQDITADGNGAGGAGGAGGLTLTATGTIGIGLPGAAGGNGGSGGSPTGIAGGAGSSIVYGFTSTSGSAGGAGGAGSNSCGYPPMVAGGAAGAAGSVTNFIVRLSNYLYATNPHYFGTTTIGATGASGGGGGGGGACISTGPSAVGGGGGGGGSGSNGGSIQIIARNITISSTGKVLSIGGNGANGGRGGNVSGGSSGRNVAGGGGGGGSGGNGGWISFITSSYINSGTVASTGGTAGSGGAGGTGSQGNGSAGASGNAGKDGVIAVIQI